MEFKMACEALKVYWIQLALLRILSGLYDLEIIAGNLQDNKDNITDFLLVKK